MRSRILSDDTLKNLGTVGEPKNVGSGKTGAVVSVGVAVCSFGKEMSIVYEGVAAGIFSFNKLYTLVMYMYLYRQELKCVFHMKGESFVLRSWGQLTSCMIS